MANRARIEPRSVNDGHSASVFDAEKNEFPVYRTEEGALVEKPVREIHRYIYLTDPGFPGLGIGDFVPDEFLGELVPANHWAEMESSEDFR